MSTLTESSDLASQSASRSRQTSQTGVLAAEPFTPAETHTTTVSATVSATVSTCTHRVIPSPHTHTHKLKSVPVNPHFHTFHQQVLNV